MRASEPFIALASHRHKSVWALGAFILWALFWYRDTATAMVEIWARSETFTHGFIVPPISLWLIWRLRDRLAGISLHPMPSILPVVAGIGFVWLLGDLAAINAVTQLALVMLLVLAVPATMGIQVTRVLLFPLGFLFFAVPIGEFVLPQFMEWTANFAVFALRLTGVPVYREGLHFVIPSGSWSVVEACSGVRYLIASLMVGVLFAYLNYTSLKRRLIFVGFSILVPIIANWLRAYMIVMLGHLSGNTLAVGVDHLIYGWLFFGFVIMLMFIIGTRWSEPPAQVDVANITLPSAKPTGRNLLWITTILLAILAAAPHVAKKMIEQSNASSVPQLSSSLQNLAGGWHQSTNGFADWKPHFINSSAELNTAFGNGERSVGLYIGYYRNQTYGQKLVSSTNSLVSSQDKDWALIGSGKQMLQGGNREISVLTAELRSKTDVLQGNETHLLAWQIYWINGHLTTSDHVAKIYTALSRLLGRGDDSAVIVLYAPQDQPGGAQAALESFAKSNFEAVEAVLRTTRDNR